MINFSIIPSLLSGEMDFKKGKNRYVMGRMLCAIMNNPTEKAEYINVGISQ